MRNFKFQQLVIGLLLLSLGGVVGFRYGQLGQYPGQASLVQVINADSKQAESVDFGVFWEVWQYLDQTYLEQDKLDAAQMVNGAVSGMTASLGDPYTVYLPPKKNERSAQDLAGAFYGVGIELGYIDDTLAVMAPLSGTPADKAGVEAGDLIIHVKDSAKDLDEDTFGWSLNQAVENIRGPKNSPITLTLMRKKGEVEIENKANQGENLNGETISEPQYGEPFEVEIRRGEIVVKSVELEFENGVGANGEQKRVAHLRVYKFGERTPAEFEEAVDQILAQKGEISGVLLDLRNNAGGFFDGAIALASEFVENGVVVTQKGQFTKKDYQARGKARLSGIPVEVLVNKGSASASEIVAGALRDQLGAKLIGENTFGKGTVQDRRELSNGGGLHVTIARWLLPKGSWIHETGIPADITIKDNPETEIDEVVLKAIEEI